MRLIYIDLQQIETKWGIDINTSATLLITLFVFIAGFIIQGVIIRLKLGSTKKRLRKNFRILIEEASAQFLKKAEEFDNNANSITLYENGSFNLTLGIATAIKAIEELGYHNVYQAFFNSVRIKSWQLIDFKRRGLTERMKSFHKIWNILLTVDFHINKAIHGIDDFFKQYNTFNERRNIAIESNQLFIEPYIVSLFEGELDHRDAEYINKVYIIYEDWYKIANRTAPTIFHRNFITSDRLIF